MFGQIDAALRSGEEGEDEYLHTCQKVQDTIDLLAFSLARREDKEEVTADAR